MKRVRDGDYDPVTLHTSYNVILTTYSWSRAVQSPPWARRWPVFGNGKTDRASQAYGESLATVCNNNHVAALCGYYQAVADNPLANFRTSFWRATNLGNLKLLHMFGLAGFPGTRAAIQREALSWAADMQSPKYARLRDRTGRLRPMVLYWGNEYLYDSAQFVDMIGTIRAALPDVFIVGTDNVAGDAGAGSPAAIAALRAIDGVYNHACGLPWDTSGGKPATGVQWNASQSALQLDARLRQQQRVAEAYGKVHFGGTMPHFDRDLFQSLVENRGLAPQGRVVAESGAQLRELLRTARNYAPILHTESRIEADGEHIYYDRWIILTSLNEWEEGSTFEPCLVRGGAYQAPGWDYGNDAMQAIAEVFMNTTRRVLRREVAVEV